MGSDLPPLRWWAGETVCVAGIAACAIAVLLLIIGFFGVRP